MTENGIAVGIFRRGVADSSPGTVVVYWPDGGKSVRCVAESDSEGKPVWYVQIGNDFVRDATDHTTICEGLYAKECQRRGVFYQKK